MKSSAKRVVFSAVAVLLAAHPLWAAGNRWLGTWTLNRTLSHLMGPPTTIIRVPNGYYFYFGTTGFQVGEDGKDYPTAAAHTTSLNAVGEREWLRVNKVNGKEVERSTLSITPDNLLMLIHTVATGTDGKTHDSNDVERRVGEGKGLVGTWRSLDTGIEVPETIAIEDAGGGKLRWVLPNEGQYYVVVPNGPPVPVAGPRSVPGATVSLRVISDTEVDWTAFINGKAVKEGIDTLSVNGRLLTETTWPATRLTDEQEAVYERR